jgi:Zn-dependent oligopeptidase
MIPMHRHLRDLSFALLAAALLAGCGADTPEAEAPQTTAASNPFLTALNEPVAYGEATAEHLTEYGNMTLEQSQAQLEAIKAVSDPTFDSVVVPFDDLSGELSKAMRNSWMLYWVSPDQATREAGIAIYQELEAWSLGLYSDKTLYEQLRAVADTGGLPAIEEKLLADLLVAMEQTGVDLSPEDQERFKALNQEITDLTSQYSTNMNTHGLVLELDAEGANGIPETLTSRYATDEGTYAIPVISANRGPVVNNASSEETRKAFTMMYANRAADENLEILDQLVAKRHELAQLMGFDSYADYTLKVKMAETPENVWDFLEGLAEATSGKAVKDLDRLKSFRSRQVGTSAADPFNPWDLGYFHNELLKTEYGVDPEEVRKYLPLDRVLVGMMEIYEQLLGLEFRPVANPSVWHESVELYEVYEDGRLTGRFYLDLFPRDNKESHFYGVPLTPGNQHPDGYEIPVAMLLGNFTPASDELPSLVSHAELNTLFHEFGHIAASTAFSGKYAMQNGSLPDFGEAMSQIFENWIWDYDILKTFATHYETGEVLPEETFQNMLAAKNLVSGIGAQNGVRSSMYDMELYNRYDPDNPTPTDDIWRQLADRFVYSSYIEGTHPQAAWIHINTHPTYYYGYLWSRVYAQDMFTRFEENGLLDTETGERYRRLVLANGTQRPILEAVEEFLGRAPNNDAYIRSLGLETE